jgi:hypothetical protein
MCCMWLSWLLTGEVKYVISKVFKLTHPLMSLTAGVLPGRERQGPAESLPSAEGRGVCV